MKTVVPAEQLVEYVGKELGHSDWFTIDQDRIDQFADVTRDHQFIHVDQDRARQGPFGDTIAHGFLTLSMLTHLTESCGLLPENTVIGINYGFDKVRFLNPVLVNKRVRARVKPMSVTEKNPGQWLMKSEITVEIEGEDKPALVAEWLALMFAQ
ncbi:MAG: MaoC family dehydratase [Woeseia sp.]